MPIDTLVGAVIGSADYPTCSPYCEPPGSSVFRILWKSYLQRSVIAGNKVCEGVLVELPDETCEVAMLEMARQDIFCEFCILFAVIHMS